MSYIISKTRNHLLESDGDVFLRKATFSQANQVNLNNRVTQLLNPVSSSSNSLNKSSNGSFQRKKKVVQTMIHKPSAFQRSPTIKLSVIKNKNPIKRGLDSESSSANEDENDEDESSNSQRLEDIKRFDQDDLCVVDDLTDDHFESLVFSRIMKMQEVHPGKFHSRRRHSIDVLDEEVKDARKRSRGLVRGYGMSQTVGRKGLSSDRLG